MALRFFKDIYSSNIQNVSHIEGLSKISSYQELCSLTNTFYCFQWKRLRFKSPPNPCILLSNYSKKGEILHGFMACI